jgi:hypothetical protein
MKLPNGHRAIIPIEKLRKYCLNPNHTVGGHKAHLFERLIGLTSDNSEMLQRHLSEIARTGEAAIGKQNEYGQRYVIDFDMATKKGMAKVRSTWIILSNEDFPRLTSCYIL